jgi:hypothetical protein
MNAMLWKLTRAWMALCMVAAALLPGRRRSDETETTELDWLFRSEAVAEDLQ